MRAAGKVLIPVLGVLAVGLAGCGNSEEAKDTASASSASSDPAEQALDNCPKPDEAIRSDPASVALTYENIAYCWDSSKDANTQAGTNRALALASQSWKDTQAKANTRNAFQGQFNTASKFDGVTDVKVYQGRGDMDADIDGDKAQRGIDITWSWIGPDGQKAPGGSAQDVVYLEKHDEQWEVVATQNTKITTAEEGNH